MDSKKREIKDFSCSETDENYINSLIELLKQDLSKDNLGIKVANVISDYKTKPVNGLIRDIISDIECHLGIYKNSIRDFEPSEDFDYKTGIKYYLDLLNTIKTSNNFILPDNKYKTYIRWFYYEKEKIEVDVLVMDNWNYILYKDKHSSDFYLSIVFSQSFASWDTDFKIEGGHKEKVLSMFESGVFDKLILTSILDDYKTEYYKNRKK
ncbi:hypothetical protein [Geofilum rhodophaeum]|uniref:hypothetical protein n=1 Tax=Geofilum rhodophaeum TaxID=1965019 RepID=UPI000B5246EA|nr:hypothetical protein [Geofilum rhodophaeum]